MTEANATGSETPIIPAPAAAPEGKTAETPAIIENEAAEPAPKTETDDAADAEKASEAAKALAARKKTANERIAEVTRARRDAERRAEIAERRLQELETRAAKEPDPTKFDDVSKLTAAQVENTLDRREVERLKAEREAVVRDTESLVAEAWRERVDIFKAEAPDFEQVAYSAPLSAESSRDIARLEEGPQIAYYLGKNPAEARLLNSLSDRDRAVALGRLAGRLTAAPVRRTSTAPPPVEAVAGKGALAAAFNPEKSSMAEYAAKRRQGWAG